MSQTMVANLVASALAWSATAYAECPETPIRIPQPMWVFARNNADSVAKLLPSNYPAAVKLREIAPFLNHFPDVTRYADNGTVYMYVVFRSAFCHAILSTHLPSDEIDRRFRLHDAILANDLHLPPN
jgi:hypothetical protein